MLKKQETGRSMIEMLGVLAIIGVLSVGGIAGYTSAMRSYRANEIINATSMLFMQGLASNVGEGTQEMDLETSLLPKGSSKIHYNGDGASLTVYITDPTDCATVKTKLGDKAGECPATTTDGAYALTVTLGEAGTVDIGLDCTDDTCCTNANGEWKCDTDIGTACRCVPDGYDSACNGFGCHICSPTEGEAMISSDGTGICKPDGYLADCGGASCIACAPSEGTPTCGEFTCSCE